MVLYSFRVSSAHFSTFIIKSSFVNKLHTQISEPADAPTNITFSSVLIVSYLPNKYQNPNPHGGK